MIRLALVQIGNDNIKILDFHYEYKIRPDLTSESQAWLFHLNNVRMSVFWPVEWRRLVGMSFRLILVLDVNVMVQMGRFEKPCMKHFFGVVLVVIRTKPIVGDI